MMIVCEIGPILTTNEKSCYICKIRQEATTASRLRNTHFLSIPRQESHITTFARNGFKMPLRRPKSNKNPPIFSHEFVIQNHADIVSCVAMVFVIGLMFQASIQSRHLARNAGQGFSSASIWSHLQHLKVASKLSH